MELRVRPIYHRTEERVPAHIFLCLLAYYVEWHLRRAWAPLLFEDEERREERERRDPISPAKLPRWQVAGTRQDLVLGDQALSALGQKDFVAEAPCCIDIIL